jgi:hypothetical protein
LLLLLLLLLLLNADQGQCNSCVAFALLAAAQSAMACALKQDARSRWGGSLDTQIWVHS